MTYLVFVPRRFGCQVLRLRSLPLLREGGKDIFEFQLHMPPTFCFPCRFTDINVILRRPLPPSDALITTNGLNSDRIRWVATGAPIPLLKFMLLEQHARPKADLKVFVAMLGIAVEKGIQVQRCYDLLFRHCFPDCSDDDLLANGSKSVCCANTRRAHGTGARSVDAGSVAGSGPRGSGALQSDEGSVPTRRHQEEMWCEQVVRSCRAEL